MFSLLQLPRVNHLFPLDNKIGWKGDKFLILVFIHRKLNFLFCLFRNLVINDRHLFFGIHLFASELIIMRNSNKTQ